MNTIEYLYNEDLILDEVRAYVDSTYGAHYANNGKSKRIQVMDLIYEGGFAFAFCIGNIIKYAFRADKKGTKKQDLMKVIHYAMLALNQLKREEIAEVEKKINKKAVTIPVGDEVIPYSKRKVDAVVDDLKQQQTVIVKAEPFPTIRYDVSELPHNEGFSRGKE